MQNISQANITQSDISNTTLHHVAIYGAHIVDAVIKKRDDESLPFPERLLHFRPFQLDALGIVTLLGATQIDHAVGALSRNWIFEWMPLMGEYVFATNQFTQPFSHGIEMYNITDGIAVNQFAAWFARWLLAQNLSAPGMRIDVTAQAQRRPLRHYFTGVPMALVFYIPLIMLYAFLGVRDTWGMVNTAALVFTTMMRQILLHFHRTALDTSVLACNETVLETYRELEYMTPQDRVSTRRRLGDVCRCLLTFPNGKMVFLEVPRTHWNACLVQMPSPRHPRISAIMRACIWLGFGAHVLSIGASCFIVQLWTIAGILLATTMTTFGLGQHWNWPYTGSRRFEGARQDRWVGSLLKITLARVLLASDDDINILAAMQLDRREEEQMSEWGFLPSQIDAKWRSEYMKLKDFYQLPVQEQQLRLARRRLQLDRHTQDMKERKRYADANGEIEIPLMFGELDETDDVGEQGESSTSGARRRSDTREV